MDNYLTEVKNLQKEILMAKLDNQNPTLIQKLQQQLDELIRDKPQLTHR